MLTQILVINIILQYVDHLLVDIAFTILLALTVKPSVLLLVTLIVQVQETHSV